MPNSLLLLGGGIDSTLVLVQLALSKSNFVAMFFDYGQKALPGETKSVKYFCKKYGVGLKIVPVGINTIANCTILQGSKVGKNATQNILEGRNAIFASMAVTYAATIGAQKIYTGFHLDDPGTTNYPDCSSTFVTAFNTYISSYLQKEFQGIKMVAPLAKYLRQDIVRIAASMDYEVLTKTFTCYEGGTKECGKCVHCIKKAQLIASLEVE